MVGEIFRFGILLLIGAVVIIWSIIEKMDRKKFLSNKRFVKTKGTIIDIVSSIREGIDKTGYRYSLMVRYYSLDQTEYTSLSGNHIRSPDEFSNGERIEIIYDKKNPQKMYIADDKYFSESNNVLLFFGILIFAVGIWLILYYKVLN